MHLGALADRLMLLLASSSMGNTDAGGFFEKVSMPFLIPKPGNSWW